MRTFLWASVRSRVLTVVNSCAQELVPCACHQVPVANNSGIYLFRQVRDVSTTGSAVSRLHARATGRENFHGLLTKNGPQDMHFQRTMSCLRTTHGQFRGSLCLTILISKRRSLNLPLLLCHLFQLLCLYSDRTFRAKGLIMVYHRVPKPLLPFFHQPLMAI